VRIGRLGGALPLVLMTVLIVASARTRRSAGRLPHELQPQQPPAPRDAARAGLAQGQTCALLVSAFDVSVAALMTFCVVVRPTRWRTTSRAWRWCPGAPQSSTRSASEPVFNAVLIASSKLPVDPSARSYARASRGCRLLLRDHPRRSHLSSGARRSDEERELRPDRLPRCRRAQPSPETSGCYARDTGARTTRAVGLRRDVVSDGSGWRPADRRRAFVLCSVMASLAGLYLALRSRSARPSSTSASRSRASPAPCSAERVSQGDADRSSAPCSLHSSSRSSTTCSPVHHPTEYSQMTIGVAIPAGSRAVLGARAAEPVSGPAGPASAGSRLATESRRASPRPRAAAARALAGDPPRGR
jgi:hypothetical protein